MGNRPAIRNVLDSVLDRIMKGESVTTVEHGLSKEAKTVIIGSSALLALGLIVYAVKKK
jgi:hypothetical protein